MCLAASMWSRVDAIYYGNTRYDAAAIGFDDEFFYEELAKDMDKRAVPLLPMMREEAQTAFKAWMDKCDKVRY
jgi:tRNA(Arg) A34 adenosine deaminase TadA